MYPALPILGWTWTYQEFTNFHCYLFSIGRVNPELYSLGAGTWKLEGMKVGNYLNQLEPEEWMQNYVNVLCINSWQVYDKQLSCLLWCQCHLNIVLFIIITYKARWLYLLTIKNFLNLITCTVPTSRAYIQHPWYDLQSFTCLPS